MINKSVLMLVLLYCFSCGNAYKPDNEAKLEKNAKWYFYGYSTDQQYACHNDTVSVLSCDVSLRRILKKGTDTLNYYFDIIYKNETNRCVRLPIGVFGTTVIKNERYLPIVSPVEFFPKEDSDVLQMMSVSDSLLINIINCGNIKINPWLQE